MATVTRSSQKNKAQQSSAAKLTVSLALSINHTVYAVQPIAAAAFAHGSKAWRLTKQGGDHDVYDVVKNMGSGLVECDCADYEMRHRQIDAGMCKHGQALVDLGLLQPPQTWEPMEVTPMCATRGCFNGLHLTEGPDGRKYCPVHWEMENEPGGRYFKPYVAPAPQPEPVSGAPCCPQDEPEPCKPCETRSNCKEGFCEGCLSMGQHDDFTPPCLERPAPRRVLAYTANPSLRGAALPVIEQPEFLDQHDTDAPYVPTPEEEREAAEIFATMQATNLLQAQLPGVVEVKLTLAELVDRQVDFYRSWKTAAGEMIARHLEELACKVRWVSAETPEDYDARSEIAEEERDQTHYQAGFRMGKAAAYDECHQGCPGGSTFGHLD
jgi:hypothetical protein